MIPSQRCFAAERRDSSSRRLGASSEDSDKSIGTDLSPPASADSGSGVAPDCVKDTKVGYVEEDSTVSISAQSGDVVVVMLGGSSGPHGDASIGGKDMEKQGFELIEVEGSNDAKIEAWIKVWDGDDGNKVTIPRNAKDVGYGITVLDGKKVKVHPAYLNSKGDITSTEGITVKSKDGNGKCKEMKFLDAGGRGPTIAGHFTDDPVKNVRIKDGDRNARLLWTDKKFGDGDSFGFVVMEGDAVNSLKGDKVEDSGFDMPTMTLNFDGFLVAR